MKPQINASLGVIYDSTTSKVLLACRPIGKIYAGYWEFPGGKLEVGESCFSALARELNEEIAIDVLLDSMMKLGTIEHDYPHGLVSLDIILVTSWQGKIYPKEGQQLIWQSVLDDATLPEMSLPTTESVFKLIRSNLTKLASGLSK